MIGDHLALLIVTFVAGSWAGFAVLALFVAARRDDDPPPIKKHPRLFRQL